MKSHASIKAQCCWGRPNIESNGLPTSMWKPLRGVILEGHARISNFDFSRRVRFSAIPLPGRF